MFHGRVLSAVHRRPCLLTAAGLLVLYTLVFFGDPVYAAVVLVVYSTALFLYCVHELCEAMSDDYSTIDLRTWMFNAIAALALGMYTFVTFLL